MTRIKNPFLVLTLNPQEGSWGVISAGDRGTALDGARIGIDFRAGGKPVRWTLAGIRGKPALSARKDPLHGAVRKFAVKAEAGSGLAVRIEWELPARRPFLLWRMTLVHRGTEPLFIEAIDMCRTGPRFETEGGLRLPLAPAERAMFVNGWQTWSFAGGLKSRDRQPHAMLGPINSPMHIGTFRRPPRGRGHFVSDMFAAIGGTIGPDRVVAGWLSQREQFGFVETWLGDDVLSLRMAADCDGVRLDPGKTLRTDRAFLALGGKDGSGEYFDAAARENRARTKKPAPAGWCSWYYYYTAVTQKDLERNTDAAKALRARLPLKLVQLDDGFQAAAGDWFERNEKFPSAMKDIAARIRAAGLEPGVWLSPFLIQTDSRLAKEHPEWLAPKAQGVMSNIKLAWVRETRSLDVTRPEVTDHVGRLIRTAVRKWKFPFLKLDYLYLPAVKGARLSDPTVTRAKALHKALEGIRKAAGEKAYLLGCGCPLGSGIGIFDAMRIGPDVDSIWKPHLFGRTWAGLGDPTLPAAANAVRNMLARAPLHRRWWWNDPDCLLARDERTRLTTAERRSLAAAIALSGGMVLLSDDLSALSEAALRLAQPLFPPPHRSAAQHAWRGESPSSISVLPMHGATGDWWVIGVFNGSDRAVKRSVDLGELTGRRGEWLVFSFWQERILGAPDGRLTLSAVPPHGVVLLAARPRKKGAQYAGSNLHFSQGMEAAEWIASRGKVRVTLQLRREARGAVWLALPGAPQSAQLDGRPIVPEDAGSGIWNFPVRFKRKGELEIRWV